MGQEQSTKTQNSKTVTKFVFVDLAKQIFRLGQFMEGSVYARISKTTKIKEIKITFQLKQSIKITQIHNNKEKQTYIITGKPYTHSFQLTNFEKSIIFEEGSYRFPFKILLPSQLPGSFFYDNQNFISYSIYAEVKTQSNEIFQSNQRKFHFIEPFRQPLQTINQQITNYPQCCGCCQSYGVVYVKFQCDKNYVKTGQTLKIYAEIDNMHGKIPITNARVSLHQYLFKTSPDGKQNQTEVKSIVLERFTSSIQNGKKSTVTFNHKISPQFSQHSTAIGTIIANYFTLNIRSEMGICSDGAHIQVPIFFQPENPLIQPIQTIDNMSFFSSPKIFPIFTYTNMKNYIYTPVQGLPYLNRSNFDPNNNLQRMNRTYFQSKNQNQIYEIRKICNSQQKQKNQSNEQTSKKDKMENKQKINDKNEQKYMDKESQDDYEDFKQFENKK